MSSWVRNPDPQFHLNFENSLYLFQIPRWALFAGCSIRNVLSSLFNSQFHSPSSRNLSLNLGLVHRETLLLWPAMSPRIGNPKYFKDLKDSKTGHNFVFGCPRSYCSYGKVHGLLNIDKISRILPDLTISIGSENSPQFWQDFTTVTRS